ncbi:MAG: HAD family hydrolase [candidate division KSB1 bacterium]|nr:HAD family hydrolase [candidate division KSB1 bacterium]
MIVVEIPGYRTLALSYLVLDINGTLTVDGQLREGVAERLAKLREHVKVILLSADTLGNAREVAGRLGVPLERVPVPGEREAKERFVLRLGPEAVAAIGNGANDVLMLQAAALGIAVIGKEGASREALSAAHIVVADIVDALDLLLHPKRLVATLRR